jgi:signal transduction histidine kinase
MHEDLGGRHLALINAVLRVAAWHPSPLQPDAFEQIADAIAREVPFSQIGVILYDGPEHYRLYSVSPGRPPAIPFGTRLPSNTKVRPLVSAGATYRCDDTRLGDPTERLAAESGHLSYLLLPLSAPRSQSREVLGGLIIGFPDTDGAKAAPLRMLEEVAHVLGGSLERSVAHARERRLAMILDTSCEAMLAWDRDGLITDVNGAAVALTGLARDELLGAPIEALLSPLPRSTTASLSHGERLVLKAAGGDKSVAATLTLVEDDPLVASHALLRDLEEVVAAEREAASHLARARELEEQHRALLDNAPLIIFRLDPETAELRYLNRHAERLLGVPTAEALSTPGFLRARHAAPEGVIAFDEAVARAKVGVVALPYEAQLRRRDGGEITARGTVYPILAESGSVVAIEGLLIDVSVEHAVRARLVQADRLSTLGTLAAGVAHEINNPAAFILLGLDMLERLLRGSGVTMAQGASESAADLLRELRESIKRIVDIARDLRFFASPPIRDEGRRTVVDVNRTVESALTLTRGQLLERAQIARVAAEVPPVLMDDGRLGQVVVNLLINAAQSISRTSGGPNTITVTTRSDGDTVEIEVADTGVGISEENLSRIWAPFFTTKTPELGTGLGLSISREIVERAGGTIRAESPATGTLPPRGSRFIISLPAAGREEAKAPIRSPEPGWRVTRRARVLVVEDEPALARALADELGQVHEVVLADCAPAAQQALAAERFDAVLCDLRMPGMSGEALYSEVSSMDPALARVFIFMTGVGFGADVERFLAAAGRPVLEKPFDTADALAAIAKVIGAPAR